MIHDVALIVKKYHALSSHLDERARRIWAATEADALGYGGVSAVSRATGICRRVIHTGLMELRRGDPLPPGRIRRPGGGRKSAVQHYPSLPTELEKLVEPLTRGDPDSPLRWTCKSVSRLAKELSRVGIKVSGQTVATELHKLGYSLQANQKTLEGRQHPDRNAQFEHINAKVEKCMEKGLPVISVDTKKKELIGAYKNGGREWHRKGNAPKVNDHDFPDPDVPRAHPYGIFDIAKNKGFVNIGTDHDTPAFAVASIRSWWKSKGRATYPDARLLLVTADSGGSNGSRLRLWKWELQRFANESGLTISVCHFPPGTSKWNKVEHRLFSFISQNWRGQPLLTYETAVNLISRTKTSTGLTVSCRLDKRKYPTGRKVTDEEWKQIKLHPDTFHGEWNYEIRPDK
jgi:transposase